MRALRSIRRGALLSYARPKNYFLASGFLTVTSKSITTTGRAHGTVPSNLSGIIDQAQSHTFPTSPKNSATNDCNYDVAFTSGYTPTETAAVGDVSVLNGRGEAVSVTPVQRFAEVKDLPKWLADGLRALAYPSTTSIQSYTIPILDQGHDLIGLAPTGSGKTVAFAVPALKKFQASPNGSPTIVVLAPTRELVQQTASVFHMLSGGNIRVCEAYGGAPREVQARRLYNGCDALIACPGRLKDFLQNGEVTLEHMSFLVFDEADRLLDMGFKIQLDEILSYANSSQPAQTMMWSATWPKSVEELARKYLSPDRYTIRAGTAGTGLQVNENITQHILFAEGPEERMKVLVSLIREGKIDENTAKMMIFVERQTDTENTAFMLARMLGIHNRCVGVVHGGMQQRQRDYVMDGFKKGRTRILVATDVASRGLDFPDVTCVVNFIAPKNIDSYCHRIGRTGRAGRTGDSFTFIGRSDGALARDLVGYVKKCGMEVPEKLVELAERYVQMEGERQGRRSWGGRHRGGRKSYSTDINAAAGRESGW
ncbi:DEAD DEAH box helicase Type III restriction enzyme res subunit Helicase conserved C terminal domain [Trypanosoma vivax]|uniref:RNA helicase n=1 Tax=Trypanosoma vivax (strain Y486) TaxID=1055687 RepID=G0UCA2_TRYVY|nr:DEAD DEAH box helicase Type III restriction enzyme res subunit Helicase conserved C terminal domain [Trypanosoma vivax]CCC53452.1 putative mitochondrial DEAD box protein [Trypanosoma vivax Y486]